MSDNEGLTQPPQYRAVGVVLAIGSGLLIGSSFVFKKKGLLSAQKGHIAGEGVAYLKSPMWWTGMIIMILGELCNFGAYAFVEAIVVTPMGALSVVVSGILSHFILKEKLSLFGWISSVQCLLGAAILALNGPEEQSVATIEAFKHLFLAPWFLAYGGVVIVASVILAVWAAPKWGKKSMMPWIGVCSLIGGLSVSCTQGLGACIVTSIRGHNQFKNWFIYFLLVFVVVTLLTEIYYLNIALAMFNTAMVTPTYYVTFTFCTLVTSVILYQGLKASASQIITVVLAFAVICTGIIILQMTKVDPRNLANVDEHTTLLLEAARQEIDPHAAQDVQLHRGDTLRSRRSRRGRSTHTLNGNAAPEEAALSADDLERGHEVDYLDSESYVDLEEEKRAIVARTEEPGIDSVRATFGAIGTIIRARRRANALLAASESRSRISHTNGSVHSPSRLHVNGHDGVGRIDSRGSSQSRGAGTAPSWFKAITGGRRPMSPKRTANGETSPLGRGQTPDPEKQEQQTIETTPKPEVAGLPPVSSVTIPSSSGSSGLPGGTSQHTLPAARFLSSGDLVASPALLSTSSELRTPSVRFDLANPDATIRAISTPDARPQSAGQQPAAARPSLLDAGSEEGARARAQTMPSVFTRKEGDQEKKPGPLP